ncbi:sugar-binding transcriptional regulator [Isoptericola variabilis]|uniref:Transcriptional regulator, DeoR family n=1 Tax=Isoptericola variabilis (strain 225) TaxID=743718 RepID=F6FV54_ISOV2|nr:sugar-binding domain-containing protein [Isoptericola variabilis]AEG45482.1 transcriptional regulator, DeoR family [Isoptericola variabilis 225]TWH33830.1 DNA-binding transcriptional regulator LsrR (DeoR family) [Isoptericola variabilis J7]
MADTDTDSELVRLLVDVSRDYYLEGRSKVDIAKARGLSRFQVARMLDQARELGIVRIEIGAPLHLDPTRWDGLAEALGARQVVVVASGSDTVATRENVARALADVVGERVRPGFVVGVSWSRTVEAAVRHLVPLPPCEVVQLVGALPVAGSGNSLELVQRFAAMPGVRTLPLWTPLIISDAETASGMRRQPGIAEALRRADELDLAVVAIGAWAEGRSTVYPHLTPEELEAARAAGVVAECSGRLVDAEGRPVRTALDERVVGVTIDQLVRTPEVVAVGYGPQVAPGLRAAVRGGFASTLVLDEEAALALERLLHDDAASAGEAPSVS